MANEENNTSGKVIKERTVKKKAARSIVAPKADEEVSGREARRRESFDAMNKSRQPVIERESRVIKSPGSMKVREEPGKGAKMVTAPIQLTWNEDTLLPSSGKTVKKPATGWPETPPVPKNKGKEKPKEKPQSPKNPENAQSLPRIPETSEAAKEVTGKLPDIKEELQRGNITQQRYTPEAVREKQNAAPAVRPMKEGPQKGMQDQPRTMAAKPVQQQGPQKKAGEEASQNIPQEPLPKKSVSGVPSVREPHPENTAVWNPDEVVSVPLSMRGADPVTETTVTNRIDREAIREVERRGRKILKTVVTTTTTTTYETVSDDDLREISTPNAVPGTETVTEAGAPVRRSPGQMPQRRGARPAPRQGQPPRRNPGQPVNRAGGQYSQPGSVQNRGPMQNQGQMQNRGPIQNQGQMQNRAPMQNTGSINIQQRQQAPGQNGGQYPPQGQGMARPKQNNKPMSAMDKQLADIEKALGLTGDVSAEANPNVQPGMNDMTATQPLGAAAGSPIQQGGMPDPQQGMLPVPQGQPADRGMPGAPGQPEQVNGRPPRNRNGQGDKQALNEDVFKGIDTFSKPVKYHNPENGRQKSRSAEYTMLAVEGVIFVIILCVCLSIYSKIRKNDIRDDFETESVEETTEAPVEDDMTMNTGTEGMEVQEAGSGDELMGDPGETQETEEATTLTTPSDSIDVDNDNFSLKCTNVTVVLDQSGNPAALIYFTFVNKTSKLLSMSEVFPPSVTQNGESCETFASLDEYPEEFYNKDTQVSGGTSIDCCYSVALKDAVSPLSLTIHDNYETFADIGTTEIPLQ